MMPRRCPGPGAAHLTQQDTSPTLGGTGCVSVPPPHSFISLLPALSPDDTNPVHRDDPDLGVCTSR